MLGRIFTVGKPYGIVFIGREHLEYVHVVEVWHDWILAHRVLWDDQSKVWYKQQEPFWINTASIQWVNHAPHIPGDGKDYESV